MERDVEEADANGVAYYRIIFFNLVMASTDLHDQLVDGVQYFCLRCLALRSLEIVSYLAESLLHDRDR